MIDRIKINKIVGVLPRGIYTGPGWDRVAIRREGAGFKYRYWDRGISYTYYPNSGRLVVYGKLINLSFNRYSIDTLGDLYFNKVGLMLKEEPIYDNQGEIINYNYSFEEKVFDHDAAITAMNEYLYELLGITEDIRTFSPTEIEFCYNVRTKNVEEYVKMFNLVYSERDPVAYKSYIEEEDKPLYSSFYIKSNKKYEKKSKAGVVANFYNKLDETEYRIREVADKIRKEKQSSHNHEASTKKTNKGKKTPLPHQLIYIHSTPNILRLEVIVGRQALYKIREEYSLGSSLLDYINPKLSRNIIAKRYKHLIGEETLSFFSYQAAKKKIEESDLGREKKLNLIKYIRYHNGACSKTPDSGVYRRRDDLAGLGIHWCLIPGEFGIDFLESPIKLLDKQLGDLNDIEGIRSLRQLMARVEADMSNSITEEDDETIIVAYDGGDGKDGS